jgi:trehalose 6-phosphate synthase/phosphatase
MKNKMIEQNYKINIDYAKKHFFVPSLSLSKVVLKYPLIIQNLFVFLIQHKTDQIMSRIIFVSNLLPVKMGKKVNGKIQLSERSGGYSSGLIKFYKTYNTAWFGCPGIFKNHLFIKEKEALNSDFNKLDCYPIYLKRKEKENYLEGFSNKVLWPLFHYFSDKSSFREEYWKAYVKVNQRYADELAEIIEKDDKIWIHDYHLMLLPQMLRKKFPDLTIGYFQHIPFPSFEVFRLLPWRIEILEGLLGADLIGFHTYDYERHFMSSVRRLLGLDTYFNQIPYEKRVLKVDNFPMGIDYEKYHSKAIELIENTPDKLKKFKNQIEKHIRVKPENKIIVSFSRLDYTKGISERIKAFRLFLENHPEKIGKVTFMLFVTKLRENDVRNNLIKEELDAQVGKLNSEYGKINWMPIHYFHTELEFEKLIQVFISADVALITPMRDGMNLVAKEYIASKPKKDGVLILSEMAGASKEMGEAIIVNPNNKQEMAEAINTALNMSKSDKLEMNTALQKRLSNYTVAKWADDFVKSLDGVKKLQAYNLTRKINPAITENILQKYNSAKQRIIFLDYDGTLQGFFKNPQDAKPDPELYTLLKKLISNKKNKVYIISGRDKETLSEWFSEDWNIGFIAEHGVWNRNVGSEWEMFDAIDKEWMDIIRPILDFYCDRTPRSFIEEKNYSLVWHYRKADPDLGAQRSFELKDELKSLVTNLNLEIMDGDKVIEIKNAGINKGRAALSKLTNEKFDFIMALGDDWTDEFTFDALPPETITIKVGDKSTKARYFVENYKNIRKFLMLITEQNEKGEK